jgi:hypothetical protein
MKNRFCIGVSLVALMSLSAPAVYAQQTTASVRGTVSNLDGMAVADASLTVIHKPSGTRALTKADAAGRFDLRGLRVGGPYQVIVSAPGFAANTTEDVYLTVGDVSQLAIQLEPETSEVVVTGQRNPSRLANAGSRTGLRRTDIEAVVSPKRDIRDIGRRDPLSTLDLGVRGTGPSGGLYIAGSTPRSNRITIDGVRSQDDFGLNTGGLSTNRGPVSPEAIEQFTVQAVPFDVQEGDFTGGALNMIMRSGGNDFHGSVFTYYRNKSLVGTQVPNFSAPFGFKKLSLVIDDKNYGGFLSGPIIKDKLFFALSYERYTTVDVTDTGPSGGGYANLINGLGGSAGPKLTTDDIATVLAPWSGYAASSKLTPGSIGLTKPVEDEKYSAKIDYNLTDNQRITATYRHAFSTVVKRQNISATGIGLDTNWYSQPETEDNYSVQLNSKWSPDLSTEVRVSYRDYERGQTPPTGQNFSEIRVCTDQASVANPFDCVATKAGQPTLFFGPDQFRHANVLRTKNLAGQAIATYRWQDHLIKAGYQYKGIDIYNLFVFQSKGIYYFDSISDFAAGKAGQLSYNNAPSGNPVDAAAKLKYDVHSLFVQDSWDISPDLTVNYGLRYDSYKSDDKPALNPNFVTRNGFSNQKTFDGLSVLAPRVSAKYTIGKIDVSGLPDVFLSNSFSNTGILTNGIVVRRLANGTYFEQNSSSVIDKATGDALLNVNKADASFGFSLPSAANALLQADSIVRRTAETNSLAPDFKMPTDWKANISFRTDAMGFRLGLDAVAVRSQDGLAFRDLRARKLTINGVQQLTPDGRIRYDGLNITAANRAAQGLPVASNPDYVNLGGTRDIQAYNPSETSSSQTLAASIGRDIYGVGVNLSYAVQRSSLFGGLPEFATTAGGLYGEQYATYDPNGAVRGKAANNIDKAVKADIAYKFEAFKGWESRISLFGDMRTGRPINFLMSDLAGGRSSVFGVNRTDFMAFIPQLTTPEAGSNGLKYITNGTTVFFANADELANFKKIVDKFGIPTGGILKKGYGRNPFIAKFDLQYSQRIPTPIEGHSALFTIDIANVGNLVNKRWGTVKEYTDSRSGGRIVSARCADANGAAQSAASATCAAYLYSNVSTSITTPTVNPDLSTWSILLGLKYQF